MTVLGNWQHRRHPAAVATVTMVGKSYVVEFGPGDTQELKTQHGVRALMQGEGFIQAGAQRSDESTLLAPAEVLQIPGRPVRTIQDITACFDFGPQEHV